jgi:uncharacterized protein (DUF58 family)
VTSFRADRWHPTVALVTALSLIATSLVLAVILRRPDLVIVAAPLSVGVMAALLRRPADADDSVRLVVPDGSVWEGDVAAATVEVRTEAGVDLARVAVAHGAGVQVEPPGTLQCVVPPAPGDVATARLPLRALHWGRTLIGPVGVTFTAAHGLLRREGRPGHSTTLTVVPLRSVFDATDAVPRAAGLVGTHRSRLPGSGTDLLAIRPFAPGDRLRRITWPVSLRTGQLHVTTTTDDRDTDVQLIVDTAVDVGDDHSDLGTSLDVTVRAAASIAEHYLRQGDRVGLIDLGSARPPVRLNSGRRHMMQVLAALLGSATSFRIDSERVGRRLQGVPPRALVMVFSTLLDSSISGHLAALAQAGHTVLVIDTLPPGASVVARNEWTPLAWRVAILARDTLRHRLAELGVPVVAWQGARSLDQVLLGLSRAALIPKRSHR